MVQRIPLKLNGVISDRPPSEVPPEFWTFAENAIPRDGQMVTPKGYQEVFAGSLNRHFGLINTTATGTSYWVALEAGVGVQAYNFGSGWANITPTSGWSATGEDGWRPADGCAALLNGYVVCKVGGNPPMHWDGNTANEMVFATSDSGSSSWTYGTIGALWVFRNHVFVGDLAGDANQLAWSEAVPYATTASNSAGLDFYPRTTNQAGTADLGELAQIQNGLPLNRSCMIYGRASTYLCDYVGGNFVFAFRLMSGETGSLSRHSMCDTGNAHIVMTQDDIVATDGRDFVSIADQAVRRDVFDQVNFDRSGDAWAFFHRRENEVWIGYPTGESGCEQAAVYNLGTKRWGFRDLSPAVTAVTYGIVSDSSVDQVWSDFSATSWATVGITWDESGFNVEREAPVGTLQTDAGDFSTDPGDGKLVRFDVGTETEAGATITSRLYRYGLDFGEPDTVKVITGVHLNAQTENDLYVKVGARMFENGGTTWDPIRIVTPSVSQRADVTVTGRLIDIEILSAGPVSMAGLSIDIASASPY